MSSIRIKFKLTKKTEADGKKLGKQNALLEQGAYVIN